MEMKKIRTREGFQVFKYFFLAAVFFATPAASSNIVQIPSTNISFTPPDGFTSLTETEIRAKFPPRTGPASAIGNERRTATIAYDVRELAVTDAILESHLQQISAFSARMVPGFVLIEQDIKTINGRRWAYLEFSSYAIDTDIRNILMMSAYDGRMIVVNFNSVASDFERLELQLRKSISSLSQGE